MKLLRMSLPVLAAGFTTGAVCGFSLTASHSPFSFWVFLLGTAGTIILFLSWLAISQLLARSLGESDSDLRNITRWYMAAFSLLPIQFLPYVGTHSNDESFFVPPVGVPWQIAIVLILSCGLVYSLLAHRFTVLEKGPISLIIRNPKVSLSAFIVIWIAATSTLNILSTHYMNQPGNNVVIFVDFLRNFHTDKGFFYSNLLQANGSSILGVHSHFIWFIFYPIFRLWPSYQWLLITSNAALALAAIPIYLLSRRFFNPRISLLIVLIFLFNRAILSQPAVADVSEERFLPVLFLYSFYFWHLRKYAPYLIFTILTIMVREDAGALVALLGVFALFQKRKWQWSVIPIVLGLSWVAVMLKWFIPHMNPAGKVKGATAYGDFGDTPGEIVFSFIFKPWLVIKKSLSTSGRIGIFYSLWSSFGYGAPLLSFFVVLSAPALAETLLSDSSVSLNHFNASAIVAGLIPAFVFGLVKIYKWSKPVWEDRLIVSLLLITLFSTAALSYTWITPERYAPNSNYYAALSVMEQIPDNTSAILPKFMMINAKPTQDIRGYYQSKYELANSGELNVEQGYVVIDTTPVPESWYQNVGEYKGLAAVRDSINSSPDFEKIFETNNLQLYRKKTMP